jgi:ankyrin repeat protein
VVALALAGVFSCAAPWTSGAAQSASPSAPFAGPDRRLVDAVQQREFETARGLLAAGSDVDVPQSDGATPVAWAAHWNEVDLASRLIGAGANVGAANDLGVTPLMLAAANGSLPMVELLLAAGADPDAARPMGDTALMFAAQAGSLDVVRRLAAAGANVNAATAGGHTALMWAAAEAHAGVAQALLDHGAALVDTRTVATPFVPRRGRPRRGPILLREGEAANPAEFPRDGETDPPRTAGGFTPLLYAVLAGGGETVRVLLDNGADVDDASPDGSSALMLALTKRHEELALLLLDRGADPNYDRRDAARDARASAAGTRRPAPVEAAAETVDFTGYTALHLAAATGQHRALRALLAAGADPDAPMDRPKRFTDAFEVGVFASPGAGRLTQRGTTPFMAAAKTVDVEAMRILAEAGADPFATTDDGTTALILAAGLGKRAAQDITYYEWDQHKAIDAARYALELGVDINAANEWGATALHGAVYHAAGDLIRFLVENGADIDATDWEDQTPLRLARGHMICCTTYVEHPEIADLLRELGADPTAGTRVTFGLLGYHADEREGDGGGAASPAPR